MTETELIAQADGPVPHIWLNRPARLNSVTVAILEELIDLFGSLHSRWEPSGAASAVDGDYAAGGHADPTSSQRP